VSELTGPERALAHAAAMLHGLGQAFALVGGLAVSVRAEVRFTRDVDLAVAVADDAGAEQLIYRLRDGGYEVIATVEHETRDRLATARLLGSAAVVVDLLLARSGIERELIARATSVEVPGVGDIPVARAEELLALKVLSMTERRLQDRMDALNLLSFTPELDLEAVRANLELIQRRGYDRGQDLAAKLDSLL
jgi:hypothetical protein